MAEQKVDKYVDPENADEILEKIKTLPTMGEVKQLIEETFPEWFVALLDDYCPDYPQLRVNWRVVCHKLGISPTKVVIVEEINFDDDKHKLTKTFAELLTRVGFSVRRKIEFTPCRVCHKAIPSPELHEQFRVRGDVKIPPTWSQYCVGCEGKEEATA